MKITKRQLRKIIKEEKARLLSEQPISGEQANQMQLSQEFTRILGSINDLVSQALQLGVDPYELEEEIKSIAISVTDLDHLQERRMRNFIRQRIVEARGGFAVDILEPASMADELGMSHGEYIQLHIDAANRAKVQIAENTPDIFTVQGSSRALLKYGRLVAQAEGGPSFNAREFKEYAMYEV